MTKETFTNPFSAENFKGFKDVKLPWLDSEFILSNYRHNMNLINSTQQIAADTTKAIMQLQAQYMKDVFEQLGEQTRQNISTFSQKERATKQSEGAKTAIDHAIEHARNVNTLISQSNEKIIENVQKRFNEGVEETAAMAKKAKKTV